MTTPIPPAALAVIAAALDDYRMLTPPDLTTPHGAAEQIAQYLLSSGYRITPDLPRPHHAETFMDQHKRRARVIAMRKGQPPRRRAPAAVPDSVIADLDRIDAATDDPAVRAATSRIRAALATADDQTTEQ